MIASVVEYPGVTLRRATAGDCEQVWAWNYGPGVRAVSKSTHAVSLADHCRWYAARLADIASPMWIVVEGDRPVGVLRLDRDGAQTRMSLALDARARGRGLGRRAIAAACLAWNAPIVAEIHPANTPSRLAFEAAGFVRTSERDALVTYQWSPPCPR